MKKLEYFRFGEYQRIIKLTDKEMDESIKRGSLEFVGESSNGQKVYRDVGCGTYWEKNN